MNNQAMTVGEFLDKWLETVIRGNVRYSTYTSYKGYINNHIKRLLGEDQLAQLKPIRIQEFVGELTGENRLGARTIGIVVGMMSNAFSYAEDYELIMRNPCRKIRLPQVQEEEVEIFDNSEQTRIEKAVFNAEDNRYFGVLLTLYTGIRIGELCALRWENIDFSNRCMSIKKSLKLLLLGFIEVVCFFPTLLYDFRPLLSILVAVMPFDLVNKLLITSLLVAFLDGTTT